MALMIRLRQQGARNRKTYRLVVIEQTNPRDGRYIEMVGSYNPLGEGEKNLQLKSERILFWLERGAVLTPKAKSLVKRGAPEALQKKSKK